MNKIIYNFSKIRSKSIEFDESFVQFIAAVPKPRMGHRHAGSQEPNQSDADGEPKQKDHRQRGIEAPMDLRK